MPQELAILPHGAVAGIGMDLVVEGFSGRIGDCLAYPANSNGARLRLLEYCPVGALERAPGAALSLTPPVGPQLWSELVQAFVDKAAALAADPLDGVVPIVRCQREEGDWGRLRTAYCVMERPGRSLAEWLALGVDVTPEMIQILARRIMTTLVMASRRGLAHLDLCPETIFVEGSIRLGHFATDNRALILPLGGPAGLVRKHYAPPERYDGGMRAPLGGGTDVYGASATLYRLIERVPPREWTQGGPVTMEAPLWSQFPPAFRDAIRKGLAIAPGDRFPDIGSWWKALGLPAGTGGDPFVFRAPTVLPLTNVVAPAVPAAAAGAAVPPQSGLLPGDAAPPKAAKGNPWIGCAAILAVVALATFFFYLAGWFTAPPDLVVNNTTEVVEANAAIYETPPAEIENVVVAEASPNPTPSPTSTLTLEGRWKLASDSDCSEPRDISLSATTLTLNWLGEVFEEDIQDRPTAPGVIYTRDNDSKQNYSFFLASDGNHIEMTPEGGKPETWERCS